VQVAGVVWRQVLKKCFPPPVAAHGGNNVTTTTLNLINGTLTRNGYVRTCNGRC
jgi:hypothetical protein